MEMVTAVPVCDVNKSSDRNVKLQDDMLSSTAVNIKKCDKGGNSQVDTAIAITFKSEGLRFGHGIGKSAR